MNCLLAPVPAVHLPDALAIAKNGGTVAFGSNAFDVLKRLRDSGAVGTIPVYVVVSKSGFDPKNPLHQKLKVGKVQFRGTLTAITAPRGGKHPDHSKRPASALKEDTPAALFWEVEGLQEVTPPLTVAQFSNSSGSAWKGTPEGPVEAHLVDRDN
jgi:hypothetical protein